MENIMRILSWNCNGAFRNKYECIDSCDWNIAIIQECEAPEILENNKKKYPQWQSFWIGDNQNKGLGVFSRQFDLSLDSRFSTISNEFCSYGDSSHELKYFLPIKIKGLTLIAAWCHRGDDAVFRYIGQLWKYFRVNHSLFNIDTLVAGDFNANARWDNEHSWFGFSAVNKMLNDKGLYSYYHYSHGDLFGEESENTFFLHKDRTKGYHIDYIYGDTAKFVHFNILPIPCKAYKIVSDHAPIICEIKA